MADPMPTDPELAREWIRRRLSRQSIEAFARDTPSTVPKTPPTSLWRGVVRGGVYGTLGYLLVAAIYDRFVQLPKAGGGKGPCAPSVTPVKIAATRLGVGPKSALSKVYADLDAQCAASGLNCASPTCATCAPDVAVQTVDIKIRVLWYTATATGVCQCWCK